MASWVNAGEYLKNGNIREVPVYEGAWTAKSVTTDYGDIANVTGTHDVGYYAAPVDAGDFVRWYTSADGTVEKMVNADDGKLLVGIIIDPPHGNAGGTRRAKVYFLAPGDIVLCEFDITHTAVTLGLAIDVDIIVAGALHGYTMNATGATGFGYALDTLAINTIGFVRVLVTTGIPGI